MDADNYKVKTAGVLILVQLTAAILVYSVILEPMLYCSGDFLAELAANSISAKFAMILDFMVGAAWFGATVLLFPVLMRSSERIALWFAGIRLGEFVTLIISGILLLALLYNAQ